LRYSTYYLLAPVTRSALELLLSPDLALLGECAAPNSAWLFLDTTRNHRRRWCDARTCGNRDKVPRFRARHRRSQRLASF
jgi:predicted RNA-binding Zn ribbon-like protein